MDASEASGGFRSQLHVWIDQTREHQHAVAYQENLQGIAQDISSPRAGQWFAEVWDGTGTVVAVAKLSMRGSSVDISEIVKHPGIDSGKGLKSPVAAIVAAALDCCSPGRLPTLTAAYYSLISVYRQYGFESQDKRPQSLLQVLKPTNTPMQMTLTGAAMIREDCMKNVFWRYSLNWID